MATAKQRGKGIWGIQIKVRGRRESGTFATKREAELWAAQRTLELNLESTGRAGEVRTLGDAMRRYAQEVSPTHKGERWERIRLEALQAQLPVTLPLAKLTADHFNEWKRARLKAVSAGTVARERGLISAVLTAARQEWGWLKGDPLADVRTPENYKPRERVITWQETRAMLRALHYRPGHAPQSTREMVAYVFLLALRTGMRQSEITGLRWQNVHANWVTLTNTKNGDARDVPFSRKTQRLLEALRPLDRERVVKVNSASVDALFRRARQQAGLDGFRFHDSRHTAATRIGRTVGQPGKLSFPEFCKVFGWRDPKHALIYVNPTAAELAQKL